MEIRPLNWYLVETGGELRGLGESNLRGDEWPRPSRLRLRKRGSRPERLPLNFEGPRFCLLWVNLQLHGQAEPCL